MKNRKVPVSPLVEPTVCSLAACHVWGWLPLFVQSRNTWAYATSDKKVVVVLVAGWHDAGNIILCSLSVALLLSLLPLPNVWGLLLLFCFLCLLLLHLASCLPADSSAYRYRCLIFFIDMWATLTASNNLLCCVLGIAWIQVSSNFHFHCVIWLFLASLSLHCWLFNLKLFIMIT
jgi:hypothetical protein